MHLLCVKGVHDVVVAELQRGMPVQWMITFMKAAGVSSILAAIVTAAIKESSRGPELIVLNRSFVIAQVVTFGAFLGGLLLAFAIWGIKVSKSFYDGMVWSCRRRRAVEVLLRVVCSSL